MIDYIWNEWPLLLCAGIFLVLLAGLAYGQIATMGLEPLEAQKDDKAPQTSTEAD